MCKEKQDTKRNENSNNDNCIVVWVVWVVVIVISCIFLLLHFFMRPHVSNLYVTTTSLQFPNGADNVPMVGTVPIIECKESVLQQMTSYYESLITTLITIITILMATSLASIYCITRKQIKGAIWDEVEQTIRSTQFDLILDRLFHKKFQSTEVLEAIENNKVSAERYSKISEKLNSMELELHGKIDQLCQELENCQKKLESKMEGNENGVS